ncbi:hypothetical protein F5Y13DRAFT_198001 [Hypoxylon sp. FL1857]|nr:hypothetical protein F5Y13DRAFT_198001 [Hypoxylon sp. FL1857]
MLKLRLTKREASQAGLPWPKRAKGKVKKRDDADKNLVLYSDLEDEEEEEVEGPLKNAKRLKRLEKIYPPAMLEGVMARDSGRDSQPGNTPSTSSSSDGSAVYVVTHAKTERHKAPEFDILGTYNSPKAASLQAMNFFKDEYSFFYFISKYDIIWKWFPKFQSKNGLGDLGCYYWVPRRRWLPVAVG